MKNIKEFLANDQTVCLRSNNTFRFRSSKKSCCDMMPIEGSISKEMMLIAPWLSGQGNHSRWLAFWEFERLLKRRKVTVRRWECRQAPSGSDWKWIALERLLYNWVCHRFIQKRNMNGALVSAEASHNQSLLNRSTDGNVGTLLFSRGLLYAFNCRWCSRRFRSHG